MDISAAHAILAVLAVALGTFVQAALGFGLALIAAPLLVLVDRDFVPGPLIAACLLLGLWMAWRERRAVDLGNLKAAVAGRVLGTPPAALLMGSLSAAAFDMLFASLVLLAVGISLVHPRIRPTPRAVFWAGAASGFMSTISSIGGPPMALVYQNAQGAVLRANLAVLFVMGCLVSLVALSLIGRFGLHELGRGMLLAAGLVLGVALSTPLRRYVDKREVRPLLLGLCFVSALLVLLRALLTL